MSMKHCELATLKIARQSASNYRVGAVLAKGNKILGRAFNCAKSHPNGSGRFFTLHAELRAIWRFMRITSSLKNCQLYVARVSKTNKLGMARPCQDCLLFIRSLGIHTIHFTSSDGRWTKEKI